MSMVILSRIFRLSMLIQFALIFGIGCTNTVQLNSSDTQKLQGARFETIIYQAPQFRAMTTGTAIKSSFFGIASLATAESMARTRGDNLVAENQIADPAVMIGDLLSQELVSYYGFDDVNSQNNSDQNQSERETQYVKPDVVLEVQTIGWGIIYLLSSWNRYRIHYTVEVRLLSVSDQRVLAKIQEHYFEPYDDADQAPTYQELTQNNAELLKKKLLVAAQSCVTLIKPKLITEN